jgi:peptidoglycan hydrolase CwlO-like protein
MLIGVILICALLIVLDVLMWEEGFASFCAILGLVVTFGFTIATYSSHANDLGTLRSYQAVVEVQKNRISDLETRLTKIVPVGHQRVTLLLNADSPIKSLVEQMSIAQRDLSDAEKEIAQAKVNISRRKAGPFWFVVWTYGEQ